MVTRVSVHPRVHQRHPELEDADVIEAWDNAIAPAPRLSKNPNEYVSMGFDSKGRIVECMAVRSVEGDWLVFHAATPPSDKTFKEMGLGRR